MAAHTPRTLLASSEIQSGGIETGSISFSLQNRQAHHLLKVMRCSSGSEIELLFKDTSRSFLARIDQIEKPLKDKSQVITTTILKELTQEETRKVTLLIGRPKDSCAEEIIRRGIEAGADSIIFFAAEYSQTPLSESKLNRYSQIRDEACQLSRAPRYPELLSLSSFPEALEKLSQKNLNSANSGRLVLCGPYEEALLQSPQASVITDFFKENSKNQSKEDKKPPVELENLAKAVEIYIVVGPEGGLSRSEIELAQNKHRFQRCSLGPRVFRTDTAAVVACSIVKMNV